MGKRDESWFSFPAFYHLYVLEQVVFKSIKLSNLKNNCVDLDEESLKVGRCLRLGFLEAEAGKGLPASVISWGKPSVETGRRNQEKE